MLLFLPFIYLILYSGYLLLLVIICRYCCATCLSGPWIGWFDWFFRSLLIVFEVGGSLFLHPLLFPPSPHPTSPLFLCCFLSLRIGFERRIHYVCLRRQQTNNNPTINKSCFYSIVDSKVDSRSRPIDSILVQFRKKKNLKKKFKKIKIKIKKINKW